ncbi:MBL fold metallo-hydrolase [Candidatus Bathyarchaeota archaeon]|nr:MBL fold metallo-hydrolase [Candidatus Bathyarchaeota archaeon]
MLRPEMDVNIHPIDFGFNQCYIIQSAGTIMIDGGPPSKTEEFMKAMEKIPVEPEDVQLIILTHGHFDHIGSAKEIKEITGAEIVMHQLDRDYLEKPFQRVPKGVGVWGGTLSSMLHIAVPFIQFPAAQVDIVLGDEGMSLTDLGIPGRVIHTPGHTAGSVSVLLDSGDAFIGCLAQNKFPLRLNPGLPVLADSIEKVKESWKRLFELGVETAYPGHGKPFPADIIRKALM